MKIDANAALQFIGKWLAIGAVLHFGLKVGGWLDGVIPWPS